MSTLPIGWRVPAVPADGAYNSRKVKKATTTTVSMAEMKSIPNQVASKEDKL